MRPGQGGPSHRGPPCFIQPLVFQTHVPKTSYTCITVLVEWYHRIYWEYISGSGCLGFKMWFVWCSSQVWFVSICVLLMGGYAKASCEWRFTSKKHNSAADASAKICHTSAHSIRRCRAAGVGKLACYRGCFRCRRPPSLGVSWKIWKVTFKNDALACISQIFCILRISNLAKILDLGGVSAFLGDLGGNKKSSKNYGNSPKNHRSGKAVFGDGFLTIFDAFLYSFQSAKHCKSWKTTTWNVAKTL